MGPQADRGGVVPRLANREEHDVIDRRRWDPWAPHPRRRRVEQPPAPVRDNLPADLDDLKKADLVALAGKRGLDTDGTRATLIARLRGED